MEFGFSILNHSLGFSFYHSPTENRSVLPHDASVRPPFVKQTSKIQAPRFPDLGMRFLQVGNNGSVNRLSAKASYPSVIVIIIGNVNPAYFIGCHGRLVLPSFAITYPGVSA
jgi:hypothetical protein